jgi:hypothetical protein
MLFTPSLPGEGKELYTKGVFMSNVLTTFKQWVFKTAVRHQYGDSKKPCTHRDLIQPVTPRTPQGCEECLAIGDTWVHLRLCLICGHVGCCDWLSRKIVRKIVMTPILTGKLPQNIPSPRIYKRELLFYNITISNHTNQQRLAKKETLSHAPRCNEGDVGFSKYCH